MIKTGRHHVAREIHYEQQIIAAYREAVLLREGDRYELYDPYNENTLASGMSEDFVKMLLQRSWIIPVG